MPVPGIPSPPNLGAMSWGGYALLILLSAVGVAAAILLLK